LDTIARNNTIKIKAHEVPIYYADIDGVFTDAPTILGILTQKQLIYPFRVIKIIFRHQLEMAFGRVDFADVSYSTLSSTINIELYNLNFTIIE
jgi:hypothetical protein